MKVHCKGTTFEKGVFRYLSIHADSCRFVLVNVGLWIDFYAIAVGNPFHHIRR